jgi:hypothetical protein
MGATLRKQVSIITTIHNLPTHRDVAKAACPASAAQRAEHPPAHAETRCWPSARHCPRTCPACTAHTPCTAWRRALLCCRHADEHFYRTCCCTIPMPCYLIRKVHAQSSWQGVRMALCSYGPAAPPLQIATYQDSRSRLEARPFLRPCPALPPGSAQSSLGSVYSNRPAAPEKKPCVAQQQGSMRWYTTKVSWT